MSKWKIAGITAAIAAGAAALVAKTRPDSFRVERSTLIDAPPEAITPLIDDFHSWASWSPFEKLDPAMKRTFSGAERGPGAVYGWEGNAKAGVGSMSVISSSPSLVSIRLQFTKPMASQSTADFTLEPQGSATRVTWAMHGPQNFVSKLMSLFMNMDKYLGKHFDEGLASLKNIAEKR